MPGYPFKDVIFKNNDYFPDFRCPECELLLKDPVQLLGCGHLLCKSCAEGIISRYPSPVCPEEDCREPFDDENGNVSFMRS